MSVRALISALGFKLHRWYKLPKEDMESMVTLFVHDLECITKRLEVYSDETGAKSTIMIRGLLGDCTSCFGLSFCRRIEKAILEELALREWRWKG